MTKNSQWVEQYQYDANGNRTLATSTERGVSGTTASYNLGDQLQSQGNTSYSYDGNGRLSQKTTGTEVATYHYDSQGRLKQVQTPDYTIQYRHNALGNRVAKLKDRQVIERYLWQDKTTLLATYDGDGNLKQRFNYTLGHAPTSFTENGNTYYMLTDQLGSPRVITDSAGQVVKSVEYDAYGNVTADSNPTITLPFGFAGGLKDDDTGLIRFVCRWCNGSFSICMVKAYHDFIASPRMLKYAAVVGVLLLVSPVLGIFLGVLEEKYGIASGRAYISFIPGILIYWWGVLWLLNRKKSGYFLLFFGWLANSWCIFPFMNDHYQSLHLPSFIFLTLLGVVLSMVIASSREVKSWLRGVR